jgi:hypothetical protein
MDVHVSELIVLAVVADRLTAPKLSENLDLFTK